MSLSTRVASRSPWSSRRTRAGWTSCDPSAFRQTSTSSSAGRRPSRRTSRCGTASGSASSEWSLVDDPTTLFLLRHGEIDRPPVAQFDDAVLTERGREQIHGMALRWKHRTPDVIYCSPLARAVESASICAAVFRRPIRTDHAIEEWAATEQDVPQATYKDLERKCWADFDFRNDTGESLNHATVRVASALTDIARHHPGRPVMVAG